MELKAGYKQTEVGVIPEDWEVKRLGEVCQLINGRGFKPFEWKTNGLPIIRIQNLNGSDEFNYYSGSYDTKILISHGQLLFAWSGSKGTSFGPHIWNGSLALLNYHTWKVVVRESIVNPDFYYYLLRHLTTYIEDKAHGGSALVHTQKWEMETFPLAFPADIPEQKAIAKALSDMDSLLSGLDSLIAKKRDIKQATMQQLLTGKTRLPGFSGEWEVKRLREVGSTYGGLTGKSKSDFGSGSGEYITFMNVMKNTVIDCLAFEKVHVSEHEMQNRVRRGDLIFNGSSETPEEVGLCAVVLDEVRSVYLNSFCFGFRCQNTDVIDGSFIARFFRSDAGRDLVKSLAQGSTRYNLSKVALLNLRIPLPPLPEQQAIAKVLTDMDEELAALEQRRDKTRELKQAMMQELLTGRTRLV